MTIFFTLLEKIIPLYFIIGLGYLGGKYFNVQKETIANLVLYIIAPLVIFNGAATVLLTPSILALPFIFSAVGCILCGLWYLIGTLIWRGKEKNILAFSAGDGNIGYFGIPVAISLFGKSIAPLIILVSLGFILFENTLGFFITAKGSHTAKESILRLLKLPTIYAFFLGLLVNYLGPKLISNTNYSEFMLNIQMVYSVLGMMLIGLGIATINEFAFDFKFISLTSFVKFIMWPLAIIGLVVLDQQYFHFYTTTTYRVMLFASVVPMAANTVVFATVLKSHPSKAAVAVLFSTIIALFYIPFFVEYILPLF
jgi:predicted permease